MYSIPPLPREALLHEIHRHSRVNDPSDSPSDLVCESPRSANGDGSSPTPRRHLLPQHNARITPPWQHLHRLTPTSHLRLRPGLADKHDDLEYLLSVYHLQDLVHPRPDPFQSVRGPNRPDQHDLLSRDSPGGLPFEQFPDVAQLMRYAYAGCKKDDCAVGMEAIETTIRAFDEAGDCYCAGGRGAGFVVEFRRHAGAFGDDQGHRCCLLRGDHDGLFSLG